MKFETLSGEPIAVLFNYAVHSIATFNTWILSGDLAGAAKRVVEQHYGDKVVGLFTSGAAGDQNPKFAGYSQVVAMASAGAAPATKDRSELRRLSFLAMEAQGYMLGAEVVRVANQIQAKTTAPRISAAETVFTCPAK